MNQLLSLVASGPTRHSLIARLPELARLVGPVKAPSMRTARRISNTLKAGWPASAWQEVLDAELLLYSGTRRAPARMLEEMAGLGPLWSGRVVAVCDSSESRRLAALERLGAEIVFVNIIDEREKLVSVDGDEKAARRVRRVLAQAGARPILLRMGARSQFRDSVESLEAGTLAMLQAATRELCRAGLRGDQARRLATQAMLSAVRGFTRKERLAPQHERALRRAGDLLLDQRA